MENLTIKTKLTKDQVAVRIFCILYEYKNYRYMKRIDVIDNTGNDCCWLTFEHKFNIYADPSDMYIYCTTTHHYKKWNTFTKSKLIAIHNIILNQQKWKRSQ